jgi:hypothetical protein
VNAAFPRRHKKKILVFLGLGACTILLLAGRRSEPYYHGRPLSDWLHMYTAGAPGPDRFAADPDRPLAENAIREIGAKAIPCLLAWINYEPPAYRPGLGKLYWKLPSAIRNSGWVQRTFVNPEAEHLSYASCMAFGLLGSAAEPAVPDLVRIAGAGKQSMRRDRALFALARLGPPALPVFRRLLSSPETQGLDAVVSCVRFLRKDAEPLAPLLVEHLWNTNVLVALASAGVLRDLRLNPATVIPGLVQCLRDPKCPARVGAPGALGHFGACAAEALPALTNALADPDTGLRPEAAAALARISASLARTNTAAQ